MTEVTTKNEGCLREVNAQIKFLEESIEELETLKISLTQALGRAKNLKMFLEHD